MLLINIGTNKNNYNDRRTAMPTTRITFSDIVTLTAK